MDRKWDFALLDQADVLGVALDHEGRIVDWSASCERTTGYSFGEVHGRCVWDFLLAPEEREPVKKVFGELLGLSFPSRHENAWLTKSGERRWIMWNNASIVGPDGRVEYVIGTGVDMTERKRLEEERLQLLAIAEHERESARRSALLVTSIVENIPDMIFVKDAKTLAFVLLNRAAEELLGWSRTEMLGKTGREFFPEDEMRFFAEKDRAVLSSGDLLDIPEEPIQTLSKGERILHTKKVPIKGDGSLIYLLGISRDITERKRAEEAQHFLSDASKVLAGSLDYETTLARVAELAVPRLADWCFVDVVEEDGTLRPVALAHSDPSKVRWLRELQQRYPLVPECVRARVARTGRSELANDPSASPGEAALQDAALCLPLQLIGAKTYIAVPLPGRDRTLGVLTVAFAESRRRHTVEDLALAEEVGRRAALAIENARLYQGAQQAIRAREDLLAVVSHDLRNPLHAITMNAGLLARMAPPGETGDRAREKARQIQRSGERMDRLIHSLLDAAAIEAGHFPLERSPHDVEALIAEAFDLMLPLVHERGLRLTRQLGKGLAFVDCDRERLLQVFSNVIGNAVKFTPVDGSISVSAEREGEMVRFAVTDTGPGIPEEALQHVFDRYWQASRAGRAGVGLGLYIVKGIIEAHGGRAWVESHPASGSTFFFTLPAPMQPEDRPGA